MHTYVPRIRMSTKDRFVALAVLLAVPGALALAAITHSALPLVVALPGILEGTWALVASSRSRKQQERELSLDLPLPSTR